MERGHYGGRYQPTDTRQGTYAVTPAGAFLASINTRDAGEMARMLEQALAKWKKLDAAERLGDEFVQDKGTRFERFYPEDGLILRCVARDLEVQEDLSASDWRRGAWNQDFAWFRRDEVMSMLPEAQVGATRAMPKKLLRRLTELHLVDIVRGQTPPYDEGNVKLAELTLEVTAVDEGALQLTLAGRTKAEREGNEAQGLAFELIGRAKFDGKRFTQFDLLAIGERWGGTKYNAREGQEPSPLGIALVLDADAPRVAPANYWRYGWR